MKNVRLIACLVIALVFGVAFQSCDDDKEPLNTPKIAICLKNPTNTWRQALQKYAEEGLKKNNIEEEQYYLVHASNGVEQSRQLQKAIDKGYRVIIISPEGIEKKDVDDAIAQGAKIIFMEEAVTSNYSAFVYTDNRQIGEVAAEYVSSRGKNIAAFYVNQDKAVSTARINGFIDRMEKENPNAKVTTFELDRYSRKDGREAALKVIDAGGYDAIYAQDDEVALGALEAIKQTGTKEIECVIGCGGSEDFFSAIRGTEYTKLATTLYSPQMMETCVDLAVKIYKKQTVSIENPQETRLINDKNIGNLEAAY